MTVFSVRHRACAIWRLLLPRVTSLSTSTSRWVRWAGRTGGVRELDEWERACSRLRTCCAEASIPSSSKSAHASLRWSLPRRRLVRSFCANFDLGLSLGRIRASSGCRFRALSGGFGCSEVGRCYLPVTSPEQRACPAHDPPETSRAVPGKGKGWHSTELRDQAHRGL